MPAGAAAPDLRVASEEKNALAAFLHLHRVANRGTLPKRIIMALHAQPGLTIQEIADLLGCTHSTATYHLDDLRAKSLLRSDRDGRVVRHYLCNHEPMHIARMRIFLQDPIRRRVIQHLLEHHGASINHIAKALQLTHGRTKRILDLLQEAGFIRVDQPRKRTHKVRCLPTMVQALQEIHPEKQL